MSWRTEVVGAQCRLRGAMRYAVRAGRRFCSTWFCRSRRTWYGWSGPCLQDQQRAAWQKLHADKPCPQPRQLARGITRRFFPT